MNIPSTQVIVNLATYQCEDHIRNEIANDIFNQLLKQEVISEKTMLGIKRALEIAVESGMIAQRQFMKGVDR